MNKNHIIFLVMLAVTAGLAFILFDQEKTNNILNDKTAISTTTQYKSYTTDPEKEEYMIPKVEPKKYSELTPLPEDFEEFIIASGTVRFGLPKDLGLVNTGSSDNTYHYQTKDYNQIIAADLQGEDDYVVTSGYQLFVQLNLSYGDKGYGSRCLLAINRKTCYETDLLDNWYTYRLNDNYFEENLQYIYIAQSKIFGSLEMTLYPPQTADIEETEALFTEILKTVELIEVVKE
ncbi:MAG: hypothetical protein H6779_02705 [Candidatus Nomurabacteria bacterium]|nr:hypothetical protein [Candidatus Nomurabacteria bacterium]USN87300.1 MAG: hypothetical protein H6779_02705 [Candidatus Nomurabacteria bacterium]